MEIMVIMVMMVIMVNMISLLYRQLPRGRHISERKTNVPQLRKGKVKYFFDEDMLRKTKWQKTIMSCYHFYVMMMSMAVSVHASVTDWILTDGLINLSSTNKDQPFEFHNRRTFPIFPSRSKLFF